MNTYKNILLVKNTIQGFLSDWFSFHSMCFSEFFVIFWNFTLLYHRTHFFHNVFT